MSGVPGRLEEVSRLVGNTPLVRLREGKLELYVKLEYANPTGSHKDRIAVYMLKRAFREQGLRPGGCVTEASSGNTAVSVAWAARLLGVKATIFVERGASEVKKALVRLLGAEVVEAEEEGEARKLAEERARERGCVFLDQNGNDANHLAHYETTGPEILRQVGEVDAFVMGVGTGGTVTGVARYLKERLGGHVLVVGVVPKGSPIAGGSGGGRVEGLASSYEPPLFARYRGYVDAIVEVEPSEAARHSVLLATGHGLLAGPSTGAAYAAVRRLAEEGAIGPRGRVVIVAADALYRYPELIEEIARLDACQRAKPGSASRVST